MTTSKALPAGEVGEQARTLFRLARSSATSSEASTIGRGVFSHLRGRGFGLIKISRCAYDVRTVGRKNPRRLNADARGNAGDENALSVQIGS